MKLYKYTSAKYALEFLRTRELKVTTLEDTNDPDEWVPYRMAPDGRDYLADPSRRKLFRENVGAKFGFISLSSQMDNNVMWGHYADKFRGIVLEFEVQPQAKIRPVIYQPTRYVLQDAVSYKDGEHLELIARKSSEWSYEAEWRCFVCMTSCRKIMNDQNEPIYFIKPEPDFLLSGLLLGPECTLSFSNITERLKPWSGHNLLLRRMTHDSLTFALRVSQEYVLDTTNNGIRNHIVDTMYRYAMTSL